MFPAVEVRVNRGLIKGSDNKKEDRKKLHEYLMNKKPANLTNEERRKLKKQIMLKQLDAEIEKTKRLAESV